MSKHAFVVDVSGREHLEEWRPIPGYTHYEASNLGRVRSGSRILKQRLMRQGYPVVELSMPGHGSRESLVHRQVLLAFRGEPPEGYEACHNNGVRTDNRLANLRWDSHSANSVDAVNHGTQHHVRKTHCKRGHPYDDANTYHMRSKRGRVCLECKRMLENQRYHRRREAGFVR